MPSPLGLVGFRSSTVVNDFNSLPQSYQNKSGRFSSLITRGSKFYYRPVGDLNQAKTSQVDKLYGTIDDDSINDIHNLNLNSIIAYCQQEKFPAMSIDPIDFAYLRDVGVYPNNRLVICRRFASPVPNDLTALSMKPISTLVSWYDEFPVKVDFGEQWETSEGDFVKIFDEMFNLSNSGSSLGGGIKAITDIGNSITPLPGLTEALQLEILKKLGFTDADSKNLPQGNPNLLSQAKVRKVGSGDGLKSDISLTFRTVYEQKFINNIDPELMFLDILGNVLRFGTSKSEFYITGKGGTTIREFFAKAFSGDWIGAIGLVIDVIVKALGAFLETVKDAAVNAIQTASENGVGQSLKDIGSTLLDPVLSKFKVKLGGILSALTGESSTPWHVTIGNPKKPTFCSGDMLVDTVSIKLGDTLAFNDMPSTIEVEFTMKGARSYGMQEIFDKFSCGAGRSYISLPSIFEAQVIGNYVNKVNLADDKELILTNDEVVKLSQGDFTPDYLTDGDKQRVETARKSK